jgi:homoserine kinase type II
MAVYTDITDAELAAFLADFDLGSPLSFKGIAEGVENSNFMLETEGGRYILTVYERRVRAGDLPFFLGLMQWLASRGYPSATPITDRSGQVLKSLRGKPAAIVGFLPGLSARRPTVANCREAGAGLGWLHMAAAGFSGRRRNALGQDAWTAIFAPLACAANTLKPGLARIVAADLARFEAHWPRGLPRGIIHADYFPDNVFFADGRFAGTIDFYFAARDTLAYDIAVALNAWCFEEGGAFNLALSAAFLEGYQTRRSLSVAEKAALPLLAHGAAMRFFLTRLHDWGATPAGSLVRPKDPLEYERKLAVHRGGLSLFGPAS